MTRDLTIAEISALDCPTICKYFSSEEIMAGLRAYLEQTASTHLGNADGTMLFAVAYAKYEGVSLHSSVAFERALREHRLWVKDRDLPYYAGSFFREWLKQQATKVV